MTCLRYYYLHRKGRKLVFLLFVFLLATAVVESQEYPAYNVTPFSNTTIVRQDVCNRSAAYERGERTLRLALEGMTLRPLLTADAGSYAFFNAQGQLDVNYPGLVPAILDELAFRGGFTWRNSYAVTKNLPASAKNKTWTDMAVWGTNNFDFYADWYLRTIERLSLGLTFPEGFVDGSYILVGSSADAAKAKDQEIDLSLWLAPFDPEVWYLIGFTIVISGVLYQILDYVPKEHRNRHARRRHQTPTFNCYRRGSLGPTAGANAENLKEKSKTDKFHDGADAMGEGIFLSALLFTQHFDFIPRTSASRLFSTSLALWALIISSNYIANLASFFVIQSTPTFPVSSINDAIASNQFICVTAGGAAHEFLSKQYPQAKLILKPPSTEIYNGLHNGECIVALTFVAAYERNVRKKAVNPNCDLHRVGHLLKYIPAGFAVKADNSDLCTGLVHDVLNLHLLEMANEGVLQQLSLEYLQKTGDQDCAMMAKATQNAVPQTNGRTIQEMAGTFVLHFVFGLAAMILAIVTRFYDKYRRMSDESRDEVLECVSGAHLSRRQPAVTHVVEVPVHRQQQMEQSRMSPREESSNHHFAKKDVPVHREQQMEEYCMSPRQESNHQVAKHDDINVFVEEEPDINHSHQAIAPDFRVEAEESEVDALLQNQQRMEQTFHRQHDEMEQRLSSMEARMNEQMLTILSLLQEKRTET